MRILQVTTYTRDSETGTAQVANHLSRALARNNQVLYLCLGKKFKVIKAQKNLTILEVPSIFVKKVSIPILTPLNRQKIIETITKFNPQVVHVHNTILNSQLAFEWARDNSVPVVVTFHHIPTEAVEHILPNLSKTEIGKFIQKTYNLTGINNRIKEADVVIALNSSVKKSVKEISKDVRVEVINNGLDLKTYTKLKFNFPKKTYRFFFLGSYNERKNQEFLVKTFKLLPDNYELYLYGNKKTGQDYINKLIDLNPTKNIFINDYVKENLLPEVVQEKHFFISGSLKEAQSLAVIEALASGKPVIGLSNETLDELITNKYGSVSRKNISPYNFAKKIINFVEKCNYKSMSFNARQSAGRFQIDLVAKKTEEIYKSIIKK